MLQARDRQRQALVLRKAGHTYEAIAAELDYADASGASRAVQAGLAAVLREPAADVLALELERLDRLHERWWPVATGEGVELDAAEHATAIVVKLHERRCRLLGLDVRARPPEPELRGNGRILVTFGADGKARSTTDAFTMDISPGDHEGVPLHEQTTEQLEALMRECTAVLTRRGRE